MSKFNVGDIIKAKPEWRSPRETGEERYIVLEDRGDKTLVQYIDVNHALSLGSTHVYADEWMEIDSNPSNEVLMTVRDMTNGKINEQVFELEQVVMDTEYDSKDDDALAVALAVYQNGLRRLVGGN